ncbi:unnamed protein product [Hermetia illucens]|uniref:Sodium-coupled monocarboxylate transporter 1 n=1 Tax=Hermetia illucens TaxID=343691 RepID=A0A7R8UG26_HERIL|nr:unnamed protein product [Hermetia illucens]
MLVACSGVTGFTEVEVTVVVVVHVEAIVNDTRGNGVLENTLCKYSAANIICFARYTIKMSTNTDEVHFRVLDYCVFAAMLLLSASTGAYFGFFRRKNFKQNIQNPDAPISSKDTNFGSLSLNEYLLGSRKLKVFPVAMSLVASYISGVTILGTPSEIYTYGTQYWLIVIPVILMGFAVSTIYLPVFSTLRVGSSYEYLEMRFNSAVRSFASIMFVLDEVLFLPIVIYVPALAFNQVTGLNLYLVAGIVCVVCVFYTLIGGIKAVVFTDAWQVMVMFISVVAVVILGTIHIGGVEDVFKKASEGGRIIFLNVDPSPYERHTLWSVLIGGFLYWTSFNSVNQTMVQRYMSLPDKKNAQWSIGVFTVGVFLFISVCCFAGLLIFAYYYNCDPKLSGLIQADDQLFPIYVMQTIGHLQGIPGLFMAGLVGAALSSLSVILNSTAAVILEDIFKGVATSLSAIAAGTTFGIFTLGMLIPWSNTKGAIAGAVSGAIMSGWVSFGSQAALASGQVIPNRLPVSVEGCYGNSTGGWIEPEDHDESGVFPLYRLSFHWINPIGVFTVIIVGTIVSFLTGPTNLKKIDPDLISPVIHRFLPKECFPVPADNDSVSVPGMSRDVTAETLTYLLVDRPTKREPVEPTTAL